MKSQTLDAFPVPATASRGRVGFGEAALLAAAFAAVALTLRGIATLPAAFRQIAVLLWFAVPGILLAYRLYRQPGRWAATVFAGPAWGYAFSSVGLLALWAAGVRSFGWLMLAPVPVAIAVWPASRLAPLLSLPRFSRHDLAPWALVLLTVPAIVGLPYAHIGMDLPEGRAYRAYFSADFVWQMAVVSEVSKGDMPPRNPYYRNDDLRYYWMTHLLPAAEHRAEGRAVRVEQLLLVDALWAALVFVGFFYYFVRHFVDRPWAAALACAGVLFCSSFEGTHQIWSLWERGRSLEGLRYLNIDAATRWVYQAMPVDGLHRLLMYQPQHQLAYLLGFSSLLLLVQTRDCARPSLMFLVGVFLGIALLLSPLPAGLLALSTALYAAWRLVQARQWRAFITCGAAAAVPMMAALLVGRLLAYVDPATTFFRFGLNRMATRVWPTAIFLSFGPVLIVALAGLVAAIFRTAIGRFATVAIVLTLSVIFYFLVDVPDMQGVYVGWMAGRLAFLAFAPLVGFALQELWSLRGWPRVALGLATAIIALAALPTVVIDIYNTQDVWNRAQGPGARMTVLLSPDEVKGLDWIKLWTPKDARVQVEPNVRGRDTWAYVPAFGERRMSAGLPISMIPLRKYEDASARIRTLYQSTSAKQAYDLAVNECIDYLVIGLPERAAYSQLEPLLDASPHLFNPAFRNDALTVYAVSADRARSTCTS